ncbi:MAG: lysophospholipid acyltransferase family protein [Myxococcota bacterium]|nr:lysophospholipid acyltransferase family protein [Myxococcota bacterium]
MIETIGAAMTHVLAWLARKAPPWASRRLASGLGWVWYRLIPIRRRVARQNMERALELSPIETEYLLASMYRHFAWSVMEIFRHGTVGGMPFIPTVRGIEHLHAAMARERGVILVTAHLGNWELLIRYGSTLPRPLTIVTREMRSRFFNSMWRTLRMGSAQYVSEGAHPRTLVRRLRRNELLGFVLDQHEPARTAHVSEFMGRPAASSTGLARLASIAGASIVPVFIRRLDSGTHDIWFEAPIEATEVHRQAQVRQLTDSCLARIEAAVRLVPEQWLWLHRRWKVTPKDEGRN